VLVLLCWLLLVLPLLRRPHTVLPWNCLALVLLCWLLLVHRTDSQKQLPCC
jgi:hypothetical protein